MSALVTARVLEYLFAELRPHLADGVGLTITAHTSWTSVQRADAGSENVHGLQIMPRRDADGGTIGGSSRGTVVRNLGPSLRLIPRRIRHRLAVEHALDILLGVVFPEPEVSGFSRGVDYRIRAEDSPDGVRVSYQPPGSAERVELGLVPHALFDEAR